MKEKMQTSAFFYVRKISNMVENNDDRNQPIHQNEELSNFFPHQGTVTSKWENFITAGTFSEHHRIMCMRYIVTGLMYNDHSSSIYMDTQTKMQTAKYVPQATL